MAELVSQRKRHVQTLRSVAKICRLELIRDDSSQDRVRAFAAAIEASEAEESQKQKARDAFTAYLATWPAEPAQPQQGEQQGDGTFRLRGRSFLLTYNWDFSTSRFLTERQLRQAQKHFGGAGKSGRP